MRQCPLWVEADVAAHCSCTMRSRLRRLAGKRIIHPPHFGPCLHAIRSDDLMPPLGWEKSGVEARKCERRPGRRLSSNAERPGFGGWGDRPTSLHVTAAPITRNSALGDYPLSLGIGPRKVASQASAQAASTRRITPHQLAIKVKPQQSPARRAELKLLFQAGELS